MIPTPLQPHYKMRVNVRPIKHAYFVREDDTTTIEQVIRFACTQWGGIRNLIIPLKPDFTTYPLFEYLLSLHEPDRFVDFYRVSNEDSFREHSQLRDYMRRLWPHRAIDMWTGYSILKLDTSIHTLNILPEAIVPQTKLVVHQSTHSDSDALSMLALFGAIYPGQEHDYAERLQISPQSIRIEAPEFWHHQFDNGPFSSILNLTAYGIMPHRVMDPSTTLIFEIILVNTAQSLCMFWNHRATIDAIQFRKDSGRRTFLLPQSIVANRLSLEGMVEFIRANFSLKGHTSNLHIRYYGWSSEDVNRLQSAITDVKGLEKFTDNHYHIKYPNHRNQRETANNTASTTTRYVFEEGLRYPSSYFEGIKEQPSLNVQLDYGRNEVFFTPPSDVQLTGDSVAIDFDSDVWQRYPQHSEISRKIFDGSYFTRYGLSYIGNTPGRPAYIPISLPTDWEILNLFFKGQGYTIQPSAPARYASGLVGLAGGLNRLSPLATKPAYVLLDVLAIKSTYKIAQRVKKDLRLPEEMSVEDIVAWLRPVLQDVEIAPELKGIPKTYAALKAHPNLRRLGNQLLDLLAMLSERQIILRGFHLRCETCGTTSWYPLQVVTEIVTCPGCASSFPLPVRDNSGELQWKYTLNSLANTAIDQDVLPPVLAIYQLTKDKQACCIVPGLEILQSERVMTDFDFIFVSNQEVYAGECKAGAELGDKDLEIARLAASMGIHHFYFCTVKRFSAATQGRIQQLKSEFEERAILTTVQILEGDALLGEPIE